MASALAFDELRQLVEALGPEEALGNMKLAELKATLARFGLKPNSKTKIDLVHQLGKHLQQEASRAAAAAPPPAKRARTSKNEAPAAVEPEPQASTMEEDDEAEAAWPAPQAVDFVEVTKKLGQADTESFLEGLKCSTLREYCAYLALEEGATSKGELVQRLLTRLEGQWPGVTLGQEVAAKTEG